MHPGATRIAASSLILLAGTCRATLAGTSFPAVVDLTALDGTDGFIINGAQFYDSSGRALSGTGDINGDGMDDIAIGAPGGYGVGETYVVFGATDLGNSGALNLATLSGADGFVANGLNAYDFCGYAVSSAGDINGDGDEDLIIGAPMASPGGQTTAGECYVIFGGTNVGSTGSLNLASLDGSNGFRLSAIAYDLSGRAVSTGDINGDGTDDLIIGAPTTFMPGKTFVVFGDSDVGASGNIDLGALNGTDGFVINNIGMFAGTGASVAAADVNNDDTDDIVIGAPGILPAGSAYVVLGHAGVGATGEIDLTALDGTNGFRLNGVDMDSSCGRSVASAGDLNGDGAEDIIIGAPYANQGGTTDGASYVVFGAAGIGASGSLDLAALNGINGFTINGDANDYSGRSVAAAGDLNNDGTDDVIVGAPTASSAGRCYVVFGHTDIGAAGTLDLSTLDGTGGIELNAGAEDFAGRSAAVAGDINGDGADDIIIGAPGDYTAGRAFVVFGLTDATPNCPGDTDGDNDVDFADLNTLLDNWGTAGPEGDVDTDGDVDFEDLNILLDNWGGNC